MSYGNRSIALKVNRVLNLIFLGLILIFIRVWYLAIFQHEAHQVKALKPQRRVVVQRVERSGIYDRFGIPLAVNTMQYNAAICYAELREIPSTVWERDASGKKVRIPKRAQYIQSLAALLAKELDISPLAIEDLIHAKASLFPNTPFTIKEDITEQQYFHLRVLEKDWPGIVPQRSSRRFYPQGKTGCDVIGYLGPISSKEYNRIAEEMKILKEYLDARERGEVVILPKGFSSPAEVRHRYKSLKEKAYSINDNVGKAGVEAQFDAHLRGVFGRHIYEIDTKGNFVRELPGSIPASPGEKLHLSLSSELQAYAEKLLAIQEEWREDSSDQALSRYPWIRGGGIVAMIPKTGEIVAMASYPRFDPEDFLKTRDPQIKRLRQQHVSRWLENEHYMGLIWDGIIPLERERYSHEEDLFYEQALPIHWNTYLKTILAEDTPIRAMLQKLGTVEAALRFQRHCRELLALSGQSDLRVVFDSLYTSSGHKKSRAQPSKKDIETCAQNLREHLEETAQLKKEIDLFAESVPFNDDKVLLFDLCHLCVPEENITDSVLAAAGSLSLEAYRNMCQSMCRILYALQPEVKEMFHQHSFLKWREENFKAFLTLKRSEEKKRKMAAKPFTEYLEQEENKQFEAYWEKERYALAHAILRPSMEWFAAHPETTPLEHVIREIHQLLAATDPSFKALAEMISGMAQDTALEYLRSFKRFEDLKQPLAGKYPSLRHENKMYLEKHLASAFYPILGYGYGRSQAFRQACPQGSVFKLIVAYTALKEKFEKMQNDFYSFEQLNPLTLIDDLKGDPKSKNLKQVLGYTLNGEMISRIYKGGLMPRSSHSNIGKVDLIGALEQSSNIYFSILAAEHLKDPIALTLAAKEFGIGSKTMIDLPGEFGGKIPDDIQHNKTALYSLAIGQHSLITTPLQTAVMFSTFVNGGHVLRPHILLQRTHYVERKEEDPFSQQRDFPFEEALNLCGIRFPLFTETLVQKTDLHISTAQAEVRNTIDFPEPVHAMIMEGMRKVIAGERGTARLQAVRPTIHDPAWLRHYNELRNQMVAKTGTAQILCKQTIDAASQPLMHNHVWFAGVCYDKDLDQSNKEPELAVIVYLRHAERGGREAAPLGVEIIKKWREICANRTSELSY